MDWKSQNPEMQAYFSTLPAYIKESVEQSGITFQTVEQLKSFVTHFTQ